jgi:hypothetical protein
MLDGTSALVDHRLQEPLEVLQDHLRLEKRKQIFHTIRIPKEELQRVVIICCLHLEMHFRNHWNYPMVKMLGIHIMMIIRIIPMMM